MVHRQELLTPYSTDLIENVGVIADRLVASCQTGPENDGTDMRDLLERALIVAAKAQQQLAEQSERIATGQGLPGICGKT